MTLKNWMMFGFGVATGAVAVGVGTFSVPAQAQAAAPQRYESKVVLENDLVRVKDVTFPAGVADTGMHTHDLAHVGVILTEGSLRFTDPNGTVEVVDFAPGTVGFREANARHMVASGGSGAMRVIEVEIKRP
jgi:hypothetical protein